MNQRSFRALFWTLAILGLSLDLGSKYATFRWLAPHHDTAKQHYDLFPGWFQFVTQYEGKPVETDWRGTLQAWNAPELPRVNHGALFGVGNGYQIWANGAFAAISVLAAAAILIWSFRANSARDGVLSAALGLILGGTLGNLFDRIVFHGVRDFMYFYWIDWPVFNVADCCLVAGAGLLLIQAMFPAKVEAKEPESAKLRHLIEAS